MDQINISLNEVMDTAAKIRSCNQMMYESLNQIKKEMNATNVAWLSDSAETLRARFNQFSARFEVQRETIESYAKFLDQTVSSYSTLDHVLQNNASSLQS